MNRLNECDKFLKQMAYISKNTSLTSSNIYSYLVRIDVPQEYRDIDLSNIESLTDFQKAIFCISGSITTLIIAYCLVMFINKIVECKSKFLKAISYYTTLAFLLLDPLYLTIIYKFVGGGDMNGILLIGIPEVVIQLIFAIITMSNILLTIKKIYPAYKKSFSE